MSIDRYKLVKELFADALQKAGAAERAAWLDQACRGKPELRRRDRARSGG